MKTWILVGVLLLFAGRIQAETLPIENGTVYYETLGKGPTVILLHGGFGDLRMWDDQFEELARTFRVVRYDQPGFGKSSKPQAAYSPSALLLQLMDHLQVGKALLVGNSMGGTLAIDFALGHPGRVTKIVLVGSGPGGYPIPKQDQDKMNAVFQTAAQQGPEEAAKLWLKNPMVAVAMSHPESKELLETMVLENTSIFHMRFWPIEKMDPPAVGRLKEIKIPALVIIGDKDTPIVQEMANAASTGIPGAIKVEIKDTDHLPQMEKPDEFNKIVLNFLK